MRRRGLPPDPPELARVRVVLVRPRGSANVGAAARAMKNMGLRDLALVAPAVRLRVAEAMAVHARDLVRAARVVDTIEDAVADCGMVVGTTCRGGTYRARAAHPEGLAPELLAHAAHGPVALLFGPEDHGLSNEDLRHCPRLLTIETSTAYQSLNLAQAVLLVCYELRRAARPAVVADVAPASAAAVGRMFDHLQAALLRIGFLNQQNPDHIMFALRQLFGRTTLADHEVRILLGLARQIDWLARTRDVTGDRLPGTAGGEPATGRAFERARHDGASHPVPDADVDRSPVTGHRSRLSSHG